MLIVNISRIVGVSAETMTHKRGHEMDSVDTADNAWLKIENGRVADWGSMSTLKTIPDDVVDAQCGMVIPSFCDSHTHIVYSGSREQEFEDKIRGLTYEEIARRGGGILNSADRLASTSEQDLYAQSMERVEQVMMQGTGCLEIKSGYGLTTATEIKMLRVAARIAESTPMKIRATFLGAHAVGRAYAGRQQEYVDMLCREMLPAVAAEGIAEFVDVFCDRGFFTPDQTARILEEAARYGMRPKIHANELDISGGVQVGIAHKALSVDHLERIGDEEIELLGRNETVATLLPGASFFLGMPYGQAVRLVDSGAIVALASDFNPGSSPSGDMRMVWALGCIKMRLSPEQALNAVTINGAYAMGCGEEYGSIAKGKVANLIITKPLSSLAFIPYAYTTAFINKLILGGKVI